MPQHTRFDTISPFYIKFLFISIFWSTYPLRQIRKKIIRPLAGISFLIFSTITRAFFSFSWKLKSTFPVGIKHIFVFSEVLAFYCLPAIKGVIISLESLECQNNSPILINHHRTDLGMYVLSTHSPSRKFKFHTKVFI